MRAHLGILLTAIVWIAAAAAIGAVTTPNLVHRGWEWSMRRRRPAVVLAAFVLVLVPTLFTLFPTWGSTWWVGSRLAVLIVWLAAAFIAVVGSIRQGAGPEDITQRLPTAREPVAAERRARIVPFLLAAVLTDPAGVPAGHRFSVYMPDESEAVLTPIYQPPDGEPSQEWDSGRGATGVAWATRSRVVAQGPAVYDHTFRLTDEERERYTHLKAVAATPITLAAGDTIGVLTVVSDSDGDFLATPEGAEAHLFLAAVCGEVLRLQD